MTIIIATDNALLSAEVDADDFREEEELSYSFREIMDLLVDKKDLILTIPTEEVNTLKKGLYTRKGADTQKLARAGVKVGNEVLSFLTYPAKDATGIEIDGLTCVRVRLAPRRAVTIVNMEIPDDKL